MLDLTVLLAKAEAFPGTAVVPVIATDAFIVSNYQVTPMASQAVRRNIDRGFPGAVPSLPTAIHAKHSFDVELCGSGVAATPAKWATLLRACMFASAPTIGASDVTYGLNSSGDGDALSLYGFKDSARHQSKMVRGNVKFSFAEKQVPKMSLDLMGLLIGATPMDSAAPGAPTLPVYPAPVEVGLINTLVQLDGYTVGMRSLDIDMGMKAVYYSTTGARAIIFDKSDDGDRRAATAVLVCELPDPATKNYFATVLAGTEVAFSVVHGITAGNIVSLTSAHAVIGEITYSVENNRIFANIPLTFVPSAAGNELVLKTA